MFSSFEFFISAPGFSSCTSARMQPEHNRDVSVYLSRFFFVFLANCNLCASLIVILLVTNVVCSFYFSFLGFWSTNVPRVWLPQVLSLFSLSENAFFFLSHSFVGLPNFCQLILNISKCCKMCHVMFSNMYQSMSCIKRSLFIIKLNSKSLQLFCGIWFSVLSLQLQLQLFL